MMSKMMGGGGGGMPNLGALQGALGGAGGGMPPGMPPGMMKKGRRWLIKSQNSCR